MIISFILASPVRHGPAVGHTVRASAYWIDNVIFAFVNGVYVRYPDSFLQAAVRLERRR
jgi:hypothetical protein